MVRLTSSYLAGLLGAITTANAALHLEDWGGRYYEFYRVGIEFDNVNSIVQHVRNMCYGWSGNRGYYQDVYYKPWNESPYMNKFCLNTERNHVNFEIGNLNPNAGFTLNNNDCFNMLNGIVNPNANFRQGGDAQYAGWYFRADPNEGRC